MTDISRHRQRLIDRVLEGEGHTSRDLRRAAFANDGVPEPARGLIDRIATRAYAVTGDDVAAVTAALPEDALFELAVCAAIGQANRQLEAALAALDAATRKD
jgi:hypothetical protein